MEAMAQLSTKSNMVTYVPTDQPAFPTATTAETTLNMSNLIAPQDNCSNPIGWCKSAAHLSSSSSSSSSAASSSSTTQSPTSPSHLNQSLNHSLMDQSGFLFKTTTAQTQVESHWLDKCPTYQSNDQSTSGCRHNNGVDVDRGKVDTTMKRLLGANLDAKLTFEQVEMSNKQMSLSHKDHENIDINPSSNQSDLDKMHKKSCPIDALRTGENDVVHFDQHSNNEVDCRLNTDVAKQELPNTADCFDRSKSSFGLNEAKNENYFIDQDSMDNEKMDQEEMDQSIVSSEDNMPMSSFDDSDEGMSMAHLEQYTNAVKPNHAGLYFCHLCEFAGENRSEFQEHLRSHYDYKCLKCDYTSRTEGRLKRHLKDFHSDVPPENFSGKNIKPVRLKVHRCKQCDFMTEHKEKFWMHLRNHIKEDKRLECQLCCFVTEYKHHLEYHMRNHSGSKPYKCPKCNYECVNKSMLNSHMKSHSNVYPYRCANCHYATKYCHSLKLHLSKHKHKPAIILNSDGSLPSYNNTTELLIMKRGPNTRQNGIKCSHRPTSNKADRDSISSTTTTTPPPLQPIATCTDLTLKNHAFDLNSIVHNLNNAHSFNPCCLHLCPEQQNALSMADTNLMSNPFIQSTQSTLFNSFQNASPFNLITSSAGQYPNLSYFPANAYSTMVTAFMNAVQCGDLDKSNFMSKAVDMNNCNSAELSASNTGSNDHNIDSVLETNCLQKSNATSTCNSTIQNSLDNSIILSLTNGSSSSNNNKSNNSLSVYDKPNSNQLSCDTLASKSNDLDSALDLSNHKIEQHSVKSTSSMIDCSSVKTDLELKSSTNDTSKQTHVTNSVAKPITDVSAEFNYYECKFCEIRFRHRTIYNIHMGFHSHTDPYLCNRCGHHSQDSVEFFIHLNEMAHYS